MNHLTQLSPLLKNASTEMQSEVMILKDFSVEELLTIANIKISDTEFLEHEELLEKRGYPLPYLTELRL